MPQKSKGRRKIEMAKVEKESNLLVTFAKRRPGLFKKASELCILCGVEMAIIVFSPSKKPYSFGHPSIEMIVDRFLTQNSQANSQLLEAFRNANIYELTTQLTHAINQLEVAKKRSEELLNIRKEGIDKHWWEAPIESLGLEEVEQLNMAMWCLKMNLEEHKKKKIVEANYPLPIIPISGPNGIDGYNNHVIGSGLEIPMTPHGFMLGYGHSGQ